MQLKLYFIPSYKFCYIYNTPWIYFDNFNYHLEVFQLFTIYRHLNWKWLTFKVPGSVTINHLIWEKQLMINSCQQPYFTDGKGVRKAYMNWPTAGIHFWQDRNRNKFSWHTVQGSFDWQYIAKPWILWCWYIFNLKNIKIHSSAEARISSLNCKKSVNPA